MGCGILKKHSSAGGIPSDPPFPVSDTGRSPIQLRLCGLDEARWLRKKPEPRIHCPKDTTIRSLLAAPLFQTSLQEEAWGFCMFPAACPEARILTKVLRQLIGVSVRDTVREDDADVLER